MKVQDVNFKIVADWPAEVGVGIPRWTVVEKAGGKVVWRGKTFKAARTAHAMRELKIPYARARRMAN